MAARRHRRGAVRASLLLAVLVVRVLHRRCAAGAAGGEREWGGSLPLPPASSAALSPSPQARHVFPPAAIRRARRAPGPRATALRSRPSARALAGASPCARARAS